MSANIEELRRQILVGQFVGITGCASEQARQLLQAARWQFETALSEFFQETCFSNAHSQHQMLCTPANTPATPPNFPDALAMFSKLCTSDAGGSYAVSPVGPVPMSPHGSCASFWPPSPPEGSMHWVNTTSTWPPTSQQPSTHQTPPVALAADGKR